jgi:hypothetical protein
VENIEQAYKALLSDEGVAKLDPQAALDHTGILIDLSMDLGKAEGLERAIKLSDEIGKRQLTCGQRTLLYYFVANAWSGLRTITRVAAGKAWDWEQHEIEEEILCLRRALQGNGFDELPKERKCQALTNLGNALNHVGRIVEAIEYWDQAISEVPTFAMAIGNRGLGRTHYARTLYDKGHSAVLMKCGRADLKLSLSSEIHKGAREIFQKWRTRIESMLSSEYLEKDVDLHSFSLGNANEEIHYRRWCLENRLFLNPLNDLGPYPISARDILALPPIVVGVDEGPYYPGYFNQMKQEFVSARYLYYVGVKRKEPHFSDRDVFLCNTLDYPSYALSVEEVKAAFRATYSLFDKIGYFLNHYLGLSIPQKKVTFRTFWYVSQKRGQGLRSEFERRQNWPLRGLFWLGKDLYEDRQGFKDSIQPDARELAELRHHLEHKYLKLHDDFWSGPTASDDKLARSLADTLSYSVYRRDFEAKTLRLIKMARAALVYLSLAIRSEEQQRARSRSPATKVLEMPLDSWDDEWKI